MPDQPPAKRGYRRIVISALVFLTVAAVAAIVARQTFLRYEFDLVTYVDDSAGVAPSSPVLLNGIGVGHVRLVRLSGLGISNRTVRMDMRFSRRYLKDIPEDSTVAITSSNLLGDKYVNISRGDSAKHIEPGSEIRSTQTQDISSVLERAAAPLKQVDDVVARIDRILRYAGSNDGTVGLLVNDQTLQHRIDGITAGVKQIESDIATSKGILFRTGDVAADAARPLARFHDMMTDFDQGKGTLGRLMHDPYEPALAVQADAVIEEARGIMEAASADKRPAELLRQAQEVSDKVAALEERIEAGQGTAGQLLVNPRLRDSLRNIDAELTSLIADFSRHPSRFVQLRFGLF